MIQGAPREHSHSSRVTQARTILLLFHMEDSWAPSSGTSGTTYFSELVPGKAGWVWGSSRTWRSIAGQRSPSCHPKENPSLARPFPTFSKETQRFREAFGKHSSKASAAQQIAWVKSPCDYFDTSSGITSGWEWPCRPIALSLNISRSRFPPAEGKHT